MNRYNHYFQKSMWLRSEAWLKLMKKNHKHIYQPKTEKRQKLQI